ncbi:MAG: hypothetical protein HYT71_02850 [Candidatus Aenigmarchaeota archaeon]|nr:hypothetical protein [Candidatus Aenigmarchaeota archaeon]
MPNTVQELTRMLHEEHDFSEGSIALLEDKGFGQREFQRLHEAVSLPSKKN